MITSFFIIYLYDYECLYTEDRIPVPETGACDWGLKNPRCEDCKMYYDPRPGNFHNQKCVWIPTEGKCSPKRFAQNQNLTIDEIDETCSGK